MDKATKRPWRIGIQFFPEIAYYLESVESSKEEAEANAELIVRAVNNHEDALEAIRQGIAYLEAIKQGNKVDIQYIQGKMREVLFNASSDEHRAINWDANATK